MTSSLRDWRQTHVVAAGHRHIPAPKSGTSFPAFLIVGLPEFDPPAASGADTCTCQLQWRTKRDLLLLSRAAKASVASLGNAADGNTSKRQKGTITGEFPKSIFKKLAAAAASCPWLRPTDDSVQDQKHTLLAANKHENGWKPEMAKSVRRLDSFLAECEDIYEQAIAQVVDDDDGKKSKELPIIQGWKEFCRQGDAEGLIHVVGDDQVESKSSYEEVASAGKKRSLAQGSSPLPTDPTTRAASLGQYFASDENATAVVDAAIDLAMKTATGGKKDANNDKPTIIFVEPSCGDGRIVECLMERLRSNPIAMACVGCVLGFDIDDRAVEACQRRIHSYVYGDTAGLPPVLAKRADFLKLTRIELEKYVAEACKGQSNGIAVICFGGPPYSLGPLTRDHGEAGAGNAESLQRGLDLPEKFLRRCIIELQGCGISFLLPERSSGDAEVLCKELPDVWKIHNTELADSSFYFRGKVVTQPSILQCWSKES